jgi:hypothetical protein
MQDVKIWLDTGVALVNLVGVPVAIALFFVTKRRERLEREYGTYNSLDEKYIDYLKVCLEHPHLDVFDLPMPNYKATPEKEWEELQVFSMLIAILERAYLLYRDKSRSVRFLQWSGWQKYMRDWAARPNFIRAWQELKGEFDGDFEVYLNSLLP